MKRIYTQNKRFPGALGTRVAVTGISYIKLTGKEDSQIIYITHYRIISILQKSMSI